MLYKFKKLMGCKKFNRKNQNSGNQKFNTYNKHNDEFVSLISSLSQYLSIHNDLH